MRVRLTAAALLGVMAAVASPVGLAAAAGVSPLLPGPATCDRQCLYGALDGYLAALKARDTTRVRWAARVRNTENNVELRVGDGLWGTITGLDAYEMRFADPLTGHVAVFGVVDETGTRAPYSTRLKVINGTIAEVETIIVRPQDSGIPFVTADIKPLAVWDEVLPPARRVSREAMIAAANGYFDTLQLNDGTLHVGFTDDCNRRENGKQSTNLKDPDLDAIWRLGCADQFRLGAYRYDDRLRDRRFLAVDEERGIVLAGGFIDHEGRLGEIRLTDGIAAHFPFLPAAFIRAARGLQGRRRQDPAGRGGVHHRALQHAFTVGALKGGMLT